MKTLNRLGIMLILTTIADYYQFMYDSTAAQRLLMIMGIALLVIPGMFKE